MVRLHLKRFRVRGAVVGLALTLGSGVLLAAAPAMAASSTGPCDTAGAGGVADAYAHGAPVECVTSKGTEVTSPGGSSGSTFTISRKTD